MAVINVMIKHSCSLSYLHFMAMIYGSFFLSFIVCLHFQADLCESVGLKDYMDVMYVITVLERIVPVSDEYVKVTEEKFDGVEVVLYQPKHQGRDTDLRRAVIYLHGGGWCLGSSSRLLSCLIFVFKGTETTGLRKMTKMNRWQESQSRSD